MLINALMLASAGLFLRALAGAVLGFQLPGGLALFGLILAILARQDGPVPISLVFGFLLPDLVGR